MFTNMVRKAVRRGIKMKTRERDTVDVKQRAELSST